MNALMCVYTQKHLTQMCRDQGRVLGRVISRPRPEGDQEERGSKQKDLAHPSWRTYAQQGSRVRPSLQLHPLPTVFSPVLESVQTTRSSKVPVGDESESALFKKVNHKLFTNSANKESRYDPQLRNALQKWFNCSNVVL